MAAATGQSVRALYREPYALTLYTLYQLGIIERQQAAARALEMIEKVRGITYGFNSPSHLDTWEWELRKKHGLVPPAQATRERARVMDERIKSGTWVPFQHEPSGAPAPREE